MSTTDYFQVYIEIIAEVFRRIKKSGIKKYAQIRELVDTAQNYLANEVYGRIQPSNYLLAMLVILGTRTSKALAPIIHAVQRMFSYNFISPNEDLSSSLKMIKQDHRQFLLLPMPDYSEKSFKEVYMLTLVGLGVGEKDEGLGLSVAKSISLIWRLDQNNIPLSLLQRIFDYLLECMASSKGDQEEKTLKSVLLQMFRHSLESYREVYDRKFLHTENSVSLAGVCSKYGRTLADTVAIRLDLEDPSYPVVPPVEEERPFRLKMSQAVNEADKKAGKFGWCTNCRQPANYYCRIQRLPVCCYHCKQAISSQFQQYEKFAAEEERSASVFQSHIAQLFSIFAGYLGHADSKKRFCFSEVFVQMTSEIKKVVDRLSPSVYQQLRAVVRQLIVNVYAQTDSHMPCIATLKKMITMRIFLDETESLLKLFSRKLTFFLTQSNVRNQIIRFIKDLINNHILFDAAMSLDCSQQRNDAVKEMIDALRQVYIGIPIPQTISVPLPQDATSKRYVMEVFQLLLKQLQDGKRKMNRAAAEAKMVQKREMNAMKAIFTRFNETEKPLKTTIKMIKQGLLPSDAEGISKFIHANLKQLNPTNVGILIGDLDDFAKQIRSHYIGSVDFNSLQIDEAMRVLLKKFTLPGESQVVERIIDTFGVTYFDFVKNGGVFLNSDAVYSFSYLLMMLQSNLHNPQVLEKMTLPQFSNLSKNMNGPNSQFPADFLQKVYNSVQKTPLGVHQKLKEIEIAIAYNTNPKKAQELYLKDIEKEAHELLDEIEIGPLQHLPEYSHYPIPVFVGQYVEQAIDVLACRLKDIDDKDKEELLKVLENMEKAMNLGAEWKVDSVVQRGIEKLWEQIQKTTVSKKYLLMEALFDWVRKHGQHLTSQWKVVIFLISKFVRSKAIKKDPQAAKNNLSIAVVENKCYLFESYAEALFSNTTKYPLSSLLGLLRSLLTVSREEIKDAGISFCLEKINEVIELNSGRNVEIMTAFWGELREYYVELGQNRTERVAFFASDFLKQLVTRFLKRKDLISFQRDYLRPFEDIFVGSGNFAVKELMIGSLSYFVSNHHSSLGDGWKTVLSVVSACFQEQENEVIKEKAYAIMRRLNDSNFTILNLDQFHADVVQVLGKLPREKEESYGIGCLQMIQQLISYYHGKLGLQVAAGPTDPRNARADIHFWQTIFLPLLSIIFPMCGDWRTKVQVPAIERLFSILEEYGGLFNYQFWKMVLQGVLRPAFEEITYTSQSKPLKRKQLEQWLKNSFTRLFTSINKLIVLYYDDFKLFLEDVFKIYENCILNHSLKLLITLSLDALNQLLERVAPHFQEQDWETYLLFAQSLLRKTLPVEISSVEAWTKSKDLLENNYEAKCFALFVFLNRAQQIYQKYPHSITQKIYLDTLKELNPIYNFVTDFNSNIALREQLWKQGFYPDIKVLPGLIKHHYEIMRFRSRIYFRLTQINSLYSEDFFKHTLHIFQRARQLKRKQFVENPTSQHLQSERMSANFRLLLTETVLPQVKELGGDWMVKAGVDERILKECLGLMGQRFYCSRCRSCEGCQNAAEGVSLLNELLQEIVMILFAAR